ncbi:MAG: glycerol-3-phosphate dehydrogenase/oxidase [Thermodesulfobacteriota bacterium]
MKNQTYDIIVIGGGITGAGIFNELSQTNLETLLIEKNDFGSGTSGKSSKLVHGGLRYLKEGNLFLTMESVIHRERLLKELPGLVEPIEFIMPLYKNSSPGKFSLGAGLAIYDFMAFKIRHKFLNCSQLKKQIPFINPQNLTGAYSFMDASTDDSALVSRIINDAQKKKKTSLKNYTEVINISKDSNSGLKKVTVKDESGKITDYRTKLVINASGAAASLFHKLPDKNTFIRPLKGSHLVLKKDKTDIKSAVSFIHPKDKRPVFLIPWEGVILLGTTDSDAFSMNDLKTTKKEAEYLLEGANSVIKNKTLSMDDVISTFSGIRPVISSGKKDPSKESREHMVWEDHRIISVTGGKLTTFRKLAWDTLKYAEKYFPDISLKNKKDPVLEYIPQENTVEELRIKARFGNIDLSSYKDEGLLTKIPGTRTCYAEIKIASMDKTIKHLDDLLMRRLRLGMILENGGLGIIDKIKELSSENLGWSEEKWEYEVKRYSEIYNKFFSPVE